jgi:hypothetical protein
VPADPRFRFADDPRRQRVDVHDVYLVNQHGATQFQQAVSRRVSWNPY